MEAGPSLRELFAELSRGDGGNPADLLRAAGFGDVPDSLVSQAIAHYAGTAPLEVAEHLSPFAVAHGPVPDPAGDPADGQHGLSLLASAPAVEHHAVDEPGGWDADAEPADHHIDVDPSALDDPGDGPEPVHHVDLDPADVDGLDPSLPHPTHPTVSFGAGHGEHVAQDAAHPGETPPMHDHVQDVDTYDPDVSQHDVADHEPPTIDDDSASHLLDHDPDHDPTDLLDGDEPHHA